MTRRLLYLLPLLAGALVLAAVTLSLTPKAAEAQCGSQASSCKNCHEVQGQLPVNQDGTGWHESHAFGDFCANCHGGNVQALEVEAAHTAMVPPLEDLQTNCAVCHSSDTQDLAMVYAAALGIELGSGDTPAAEPTSAGSEATPTSPAPAPTTALIAGSGDGAPDLIDYNQQYVETVQGRPANWGNITLGLLLAALMGGGGAFVYYNERKLARRAAPAQAAAQPARQPAASAGPAAVAADVEFGEAASLLPQLAQLDPRGLRALRQILREPAMANELLLTLARLDPQLIEQVRRLDRRDVTLLFALAEEK